MNKVILVGRLTKDPEIKVTQSGKKLASFSIAVDDGKDSNGQKITQYINCTAWDKTAEILENYVKKGHRVGVVGRLQNRTWDKPDGSKGYATDISVRELELLTSKSEADAISASNPVSENSSTGTQNNSSPNPKPEDELPEIDVDNINVQMPF